MPRKPSKLVLPWLEFSALSLLLPDLATVTPTSTTPKMVTEDCARAKLEEEAKNVPIASPRIREHVF